MGNLQSELKTVDYSPNQLRSIYNDKKTFKTGGQYVYLIIQNGALSRPFPNYPDDHQVHLQTFIVDSPAKIFQIAYNSDPGVFGSGYIKSMTRYEITGGNSWSAWSLNQADGTTKNYSGNVTIDGGDFSIDNSRSKLDAKFCIGSTCLSQSTLNDILIASNSSLSLLSTVDTPYAKSIDGKSGACNWGYSGTISYSNDGKGLTGCVKCPSGYFKEVVGNTGCNPCSGGYYCPTGGTTNRAGFAGMNYSQVKCDPGKYCPTGSYKQTVCPSGYYCPIGSFDGIACVSGTYNPYTEKTQETDCTGCGPGYYCPSTGTFTRSNCQSGHFCPNTKNFVQQPCLAGTFNPSTGSTGPTAAASCRPCTIGSYCPTGGMGSATPCTGGFVCATTGLTIGTICDPGKYCPQGTGTQTICPSGYFCVERSATFANCTAGNYCPQGTGFQTVCPAGSYCPALTGAHTLCPQGTYRTASGAKALADCLICPPGRHCQSGSSVDSTPCSIGNYCPTGYNTPCPAGYYCPTAGISGPLGSPSGPTICSAGRFSAAGASYCSTCRTGQSSTSGGNCVDCSAGKSSISGGLCENCPPGKSSVTGGLCVECAAGKSSSAGGLCVECAAGKSSLTGGLCINCPAGKSSAAGGACQNCSAGKFSDQGGACQNCAPGKWSPEGSASCIDCDRGYYCNNGSRTICPVGSYCPAGSSAPKVCPPGYYTSSEGNNTCFQADRGYYADNGIIQSCSYDSRQFCPNKGMTRSDVRHVGWGLNYATDCSGQSCKCASSWTTGSCSSYSVELNSCPLTYWSNPNTPCTTTADRFTAFEKA